MEIEFVGALLPVVFMLHEFEELVMREPWLRRNREEVRRRFPRVRAVLARHHDRLSTPAFALAVLHEFLLVAAATFVSLGLRSFGWWFGAFAAFSLHLLVHLAQWLLYRRYLPFVLTSLLALP